MDSVRLSSGYSCPVIGLGVYKTPANETVDAVLSALNIGYRHVDTAQLYGNEEQVGLAVKQSGIPRQEVFITTKIFKSNYGYDQALDAVQSSLQRLGMSYIDLILMHSPGDPSVRADTWRALETAVDQGLVRSIGVSNFGEGHLEKLLAGAKIHPAVNQIEVTPFLQRRELVAYCKAKGVVVEAYSPLCKGHKLNDPRLQALAARHAITPAQLLLRWSLQSGLVPLPKSSHPERQRTNLDVFSFSLPAETMQELDALDEGLVTGWDPITSDPV